MLDKKIIMTIITERYAMKFINKLFTILFLILFAIIISQNFIFAQNIVTVHGHSGKIESLNNITNPSRTSFGFGLSFTQIELTTNRIHYSIPVEIGSSVRYVGINVRTGSENMKVKLIDIYDGMSRIHREMLECFGQVQWCIVDIGEQKIISESLGISVQVSAGDGVGFRWIEIGTVAAVLE